MKLAPFIRNCIIFAISFAMSFSTTVHFLQKGEVNRHRNVAVDGLGLVNKFEEIEAHLGKWTQDLIDQLMDEKYENTKKRNYWYFVPMLSKSRVYIKAELPETEELFEKIEELRNELNDFSEFLSTEEYYQLVNFYLQAVMVPFRRLAVLYNNQVNNRTFPMVRLRSLMPKVVLNEEEVSKEKMTVYMNTRFSEESPMENAQSDMIELQESLNQMAQTMRRSIGLEVSEDEEEERLKGTKVLKGFAGRDLYLSTKTAIFQLAVHPNDQNQFIIDWDEMATLTFDVGSLLMAPNTYNYMSALKMLTLKSMVGQMDFMATLAGTEVNFEVGNSCNEYGKGTFPLNIKTLNKGPVVQQQEISKMLQTNGFISDSQLFKDIYYNTTNISPDPEVGGFNASLPFERYFNAQDGLENIENYNYRTNFLGFDDVADYQTIIKQVMPNIINSSFKSSAWYNPIDWFNPVQCSEEETNYLAKRLEALYTTVPAQKDNLIITKENGDEFSINNMQGHSRLLVTHMIENEKSQWQDLFSEKSTSLKKMQDNELSFAFPPLYGSHSWKEWAFTKVQNLLTKISFKEYELGYEIDTETFDNKIVAYEKIDELPSFIERKYIDEDGETLTEITLSDDFDIRYDYLKESYILSIPREKIEDNSYKALKNHLKLVCHNYGRRYGKGICKDDKKDFSTISKEIIELLNSHSGTNFLPIRLYADEKLKDNYVLIKKLFNTLKNPHVSTEEFTNAFNYNEFDWYQSAVNEGNPWVSTKLAWMLENEKLNDNSIELTYEKDVDIMASFVSGEKPSEEDLIGKVSPQCRDELKTTWLTVGRKLKLRDPVLPHHGKKIISGDVEKMAMTLAQTMEDIDKNSQELFPVSSELFNNDISLYDQLNIVNSSTLLDPRYISQVTRKAKANLDRNKRDELDEIIKSEPISKAGLLLEIHNSKDIDEQIEIAEEYFGEELSWDMRPDVKEALFTADTKLKKPIMEQLIADSAFAKLQNLQQTFGILCNLSPDTQEEIHIPILGKTARGEEGFKTLYYATIQSQMEINKIKSGIEVPKGVQEMLQAMADHEYKALKMGLMNIGLMAGAYILGLGSVCVAGAAFTFGLSCVVSIIAAGAFIYTQYKAMEHELIKAQKYNRQREVIKDLDRDLDVDKEAYETFSDAWYRYWPVALEALFIVPTIKLGSRALYFAKQLGTDSFKITMRNGRAFWRLTKAGSRSGRTLEGITSGVKWFGKRSKKEWVKAVGLWDTKFNLYMAKGVLGLGKNTELTTEVIQEGAVNSIMLQFKSPAKLANHLETYLNIAGKKANKLSNYKKVYEQGSKINFLKRKWGSTWPRFRAKGAEKYLEKTKNLDKTIAKLRALEKGDHKAYQAFLNENFVELSKSFQKLPFLKREIFNLILEGMPTARHRMPLVGKMQAGVVLKRIANATDLLTYHALRNDAGKVFGKTGLVLKHQFYDTFSHYDNALEGTIQTMKEKNKRGWKNLKQSRNKLKKDLTKQIHNYLHSGEVVLPGFADSLKSIGKAGMSILNPKNWGKAIWSPWETVKTAFSSVFGQTSQVVRRGWIRLRFNKVMKMSPKQLQKALFHPKTIEERAFAESIINRVPLDHLFKGLGEDVYEKTASMALRQLNGLAMQSTDDLQRKMYLLQMLIIKRSPEKISLF